MLELTALAVVYAPQATPGRFCSLHISSGSFTSIKEGAGTTSQTQENLHEKKVTQQEVCPHTTLTYVLRAGPFSQCPLPLEMGEAMGLGFPLPCLQGMPLL